MAKTRVLIVVKTYPTLSGKYDELVCTAGFLEDGSWIRIYPIPFRKLDYDNRYKKYQWIELDLTKNKSDPRPESFKPTNFEQIDLGDFLDSESGKWQKRKEIVLKKGVWTNLDKLLGEAKDKKIFTSLAVFKPTKILGFIAEPCEKEWDKNQLQRLEANAAQLSLFDKSENPFKVVKKLPWKFSYKFVDDNGRVSTLMIEDWELGQLYWNCLERHGGDEQAAVNDVKKKYGDEFIHNRDLHFFLGTTKEFHLRNAPNPFIIIGAFYPKILQQLSFF